MINEFFMPPKPNVFIKFGEDSNFCFHSYVPKPPNSFQKWMLAGVDMSLGEHWSFFIEELKAFAKLVAEKAIKEALAQEQEPVAWEQFYPDIGKPKFVAQPEQEPVAWFRKLFSPDRRIL